MAMPPNGARAVALLITAALLVTQPGNAGEFYGFPQLNGLDASPLSLASGDMDGDGDADLVAVGYDVVSIGLNDGDGTFTPGDVWLGLSDMKSVAVGDLDADGDLDVAVAGDFVGFLLNHGDGNLVTGQVAFVGWVAKAIAIGDIDGDGHVDAVVATAANSLLTVWQGDGTGIFLPGDTAAIAANPECVMLRDLDGDGDLDAVVGHGFGAAISVVGNVDGLLVDAVIWPATTRPASIVIADVDGDAFPDIAAAGTTSNEIAVLRNDGSGQFGNLSLFPTGGRPLSIGASDVDGDGHVDLVTSNRNTLEVIVHLNDGTGGFDTTSAFPVPRSPGAMAIDDYDGDGDPDLAVGSSTEFLVSVLHQCPADLDGDHRVTVGDLILLLSAWGCESAGSDCREEIDEFEFDAVGFTDLLVLISNWGECAGAH